MVAGGRWAYVKNEDFLCIIVSCFLLLSCSNGYKQTKTFQSVNDKSVNSMKETNDESSSFAKTIPNGYSKMCLTEYVPKNNIEKHLLTDLKMMEDATNKLDYKRIISLYYPDYFLYLQKQIPD